MQPQTNQAQARYSFNIESNVNAHTITYSRAKFGAGILLAILFPSMLLSFLIVMGMKGNMSGWVTLTLVLCVGAFLILNVSRSQGRFSVISNAVIILNGRQYGKDYIRNFFVKAPGIPEHAETMRTAHSMPVARFRFVGDRVQNTGMGAATAVAGAVSIAAQAGGLMMQSSK